MPISVKETVEELNAMRVRSDELAQDVAGMRASLKKDTKMLVSLVRGSRAGDQAIAALQSTERALAAAGASMSALAQTCKESAEAVLESR